jgi:hypothetical protein
MSASVRPAAGRCETSTQRRDDGAPGLRPQYHADYYGAFVLDPDGHRIEAVCHAPPAPLVLNDE